MKELENRYKGDLGNDYHSDKHLLSDKIKELMYESRSKKFIKHVNPNTVLLEYGVGGGFNLNKLICKEKHGFDIAVSVQEEVEKLGINFIINEKDLKEEYYDVVICNHVLEHVTNPIETLNLIKAKLKKDGQLLLVIPLENQRKFLKFNKEDKDFHLFAWNVQTITYLVTQVGFTCTETKILDYGFDRFSWSLILKYRLPKFLFQSFFKTFNFLRPTQEVFLVLKK